MALPRQAGFECQHKLRLIAQYKAAIDAALPPVPKLAGMSTSNNEALIASIKRARELLNQAYREIDAHSAAHGC